MQTTLCIRAVCSALLFFTYWKVSCLNSIKTTWKMLLFLLVFVARLKLQGFFMSKAMFATCFFKDGLLSEHSKFAEFVMEAGASVLYGHISSLFLIFVFSGVIAQSPCILGGCEHVFCHVCVEKYLGASCPECFIPAHAKETDVNRQLFNIASLCQKLRVVLSETGDDTQLQSGKTKKKNMCSGYPTYPKFLPPTSALDKLLGQLGIYATWLSSIAYLQKQLRIFIFYTTFFFCDFLYYQFSHPATSLTRPVAMCTALACGAPCSMPVKLGHLPRQTCSTCNAMIGP